MAKSVIFNKLDCSGTPDVSLNDHLCKHSWSILHFSSPSYTSASVESINTFGNRFAFYGISLHPPSFLVKPNSLDWALRITLAPSDRDFCPSDDLQSPYASYDYSSDSCSRLSCLSSVFSKMRDVRGITGTESYFIPHCYNSKFTIKMDLGVGSFVFSQGIVSAIPLLKNPSHLVSSIPTKLYNVIRKAIPIILLGLVRVILVKGTDYPVRARSTLFCSAICY